jgi:hypothetical protein
MSLSFAVWLALARAHAEQHAEVDDQAGLLDAPGTTDAQKP